MTFFYLRKHANIRWLESVESLFQNNQIVT